MRFLKRNLIDINLFLLGQYLFTILVLMYLYNGGNVLFSDTANFSFDLNYLSDLGRKIFFNQAPNPFWFFYSLSMTFVGFGTFLYFYLLTELVQSQVLKRIIILLGAIAGIGYWGIGIFPVDSALSQHLLAGWTAFNSFMVANILFNFSLNKNKYPLIYYLTLLLNIILIFRILFIFWLQKQHIPYEQALPVKVILQKIVVPAQIIITIFILIRLRRIKPYFFS